MPINPLDPLKEYSDKYQTPEKGILRLVDGKLTFVDIKKNPLTLIDKIKKYFGYGGFNLKEIWQFVDQNITFAQNFYPSGDLKDALAKLQADSEKFDKKASGLFACWRVTKKMRDLALGKLVEKGPQALQAILNEIEDPDAIQTDQDMEVALTKGIASLKKIFDINQSELNRESFQKCIEIEFLIYERVKKIKNALKAKMPKSVAVHAFHELVKATPALKEVKELKCLLKKGDNEALLTLSNKFPKELLTMSPEGIKKVFQNRTISQENTANWKRTWDAVCKNIFIIAQEWRPVQLDSNLTSKNITWITGSSTASLVPIFKKAIDNKPALIPTGELIEHNIVPLTGELVMGLAGINKIALSGVDLGHHKGALQYAEAAKGHFAYSKDAEIKFIQNVVESPQLLSFDWAFQRLKIAAIRLGWSGINTQEKQNVIEKLRSIPVSGKKSDAWKEHSGLLNSRITTRTSSPVGNKQLIPGDIVLVSRTADNGECYSLGVVDVASTQNEQVIVSVDGDTKSKRVKRENAYTLSEKDVAALQQNKSQYEEVSPKSIQRITDNLKTDHEKIAEVIALLDNTAVFDMTAEEKNLVNTPGAILWGTVTKKDFLRVRSDIKGEIGLEGKQKLGDDIQVLFVEPDRIDEVRSYVKQYLPTACRVHIISSSVIPFLHAHQLKHNEYCSA